MTDPASGQPARPVSWRGLYIPFVLAALGFVAAAVWWFVVAGRVEHETDRVASGLRSHGWRVSWTQRSVSGFPFRAFVRFTGFSAVSPGGQAIAAPELAAEANTYALGKWVVAAPRGLTWTRGEKGPVIITGEAIRASISGLDRSPPRIAVELRKPVFTPAVGAEPFPLASAEIVDAYAEPQPGAADQGRFLFRVVDGRGRRGGVVDWVAGGGGFSTDTQGVITRSTALKGATWPDAVKNWSRAGGALVQIHAQARAGDARADVISQRLSVGPDGRLLGPATLELVRGPAALIALARSGQVDTAAAALAAADAAATDLISGHARLRLNFTEDGSRVGPVRLAPAPKVF